MADRMWEELIEYWGISEEALRVVTNLIGYREDVLRDVLYTEFGENEFLFEAEEE